MLVSLETEIEVKEGINPKFCKASSIPFTLLTQVEELQRQVANGELQPVDQGKCATPIVMITRKDGKLQFVLI